MDATEVTFVVEEAGCDSCASRVRSALAPLAAVEAIDVDHAANAATVRVQPAPGFSEEAVVAALREASAGGGHTYRVRRGSWRAGA